jgi:hypothetical protein
MMNCNARVVAVVGLLIGLSGSAVAQDEGEGKVKDLEKAERAEEVKRGAGVGAGAKAAPEDRETAALLNKRIPDIRFEKVGLDDAIDFLRDVTGANVFVNWKAIEKAGLKRNAPVAASLRDVTFRTLLTKVLDSAGTDKVKLAWTTDDGVIVISTATAGDDKAAAAAIVSGKLPPDADGAIPEVNFSGQSFSDVVDFLRDVSGRNLFVNWNELKRAGIEKDTPVTARLRNSKLSTVLRTVLTSASDGKTPVQFTFEDNVVTITTAPKEEKGDRQKGGN